MFRSAALALAAAVPLHSFSADVSSFPTRRFVLEFVAVEPHIQQDFQAVLGYGGRLEILNGTTPFKKEFAATSVTILFQVTDPDGAVKAQLHGEVEGTLAPFGSISGRSGKITDEPWHGCVPLSFGPF